MNIPTRPNLETIAANMSRRTMLEKTAVGSGMLGLAGLIGAQQAQLGKLKTPHQELRVKPRAKRIIFLFMNGGPSHVDTFDPVSYTHLTLPTIYSV